MTSHTSTDCQKTRLDELAQEADDEFRIAMISNNPQRKERAIDRIQSVIDQLEQTKKIIIGKECLEEISVQINLQSSIKDIQLHNGSLLNRK